MSKTNIKRSYIDFCGYSSNEVTGSCYHIRYRDYSILFDFGLVQRNNIIQDYRDNHTMPKGVKPKEIDLILISHLNHIDHTGRLPWLYKQGCTAPIYAKSGCKDIIRQMLYDSAKIMAHDAEVLCNKHKINAVPLYTNDDVDYMMNFIHEVEYGEEIKFNKNISFSFYSAHHVFNASQIRLTLTDGMVTKRIGYTGDIGSPNIKHFYLDDFQPLPFCDILIGECTYASAKRNHKPKDRVNDIHKMISVINEAKENNGRVLIPVFAFDRLELILTLLYKTFNGMSPLPIIVDTPLGAKIAKEWGNNLVVDEELWDAVYHWSDVKWLDDYMDSFMHQESGKPCIVLASSGMLTAGRALGWLQHMLSDPKSTIMFCGYSGEGTLAYDIKMGDKKYLVVDGVSVKNNAKIVSLNSMSSHMCHDELIEYYTTAPYNKLYLVHSNQNEKVEFANELKNALSKANRTSRVVATNSGTKVYF